MITVDNASGPVYVGTSGGEVAFTNAGHWALPDVSYVAIGTGGHTNVGALRSGAIITVDSGGLVRIVDGPDLLGSFAMGFSTAILCLGIFLFLKWCWRVFMGGAGVPNAAAD